MLIITDPVLFGGRKPTSNIHSSKVTTFLDLKRLPCFTLSETAWSSAHLVQLSRGAQNELHTSDAVAGSPINCGSANRAFLTGRGEPGHHPYRVRGCLPFFGERVMWERQGTGA